jgi:hypothetical protein
MADVSNPQIEGSEGAVNDAVATGPSSAAVTPPVEAPVAPEPVPEPTPAIETAPVAQAPDEASLSDPDDGEDDGEEIDLTAVTPHDLPRHYSAPALLPLDRLDDDQTYLLRAASDL